MNLYNDTVRPGQAIKVTLGIGANQPAGRIRVWGNGTVPGGHEVTLDTVEITLIREPRQDQVKFDSRAFDLLEGL